MARYDAALLLAKAARATQRVVQRPLFPLRWVRALAVALLFAGCSAPRDEKPNQDSVSLRFRPKLGQRWREHWIYDFDEPGTGRVRTGLSFDVSVAQADANNITLRHSVRKQYRARDGSAQTMLWLGGSVMTSFWGRDRSWVAELGIDARTQEVVSALRQLGSSARFGTLIEYPDQAVSVGDSWSIEPRTLLVGPGLSAVLRPSYTLESVGKTGSEREVVIDADVQIDLVPEVLGDAVVVEGGGTASGTLRVRVSDGVLLEARSVLHFNQEVRVQNAESLGYREFSARSHVVTTAANENGDLAGEPLKLEPADAEETHACVLQLEAAEQRVGHASTPLRQFILGALVGEGLPRASAGAGLREAGATLSISADGRHLELDGAPIELKDLTKTLRSARGAGPLYIYAPAALPAERLRAILPAIPQGIAARLMVRDASAQTPPPRASRWLEEQLRLAFSMPSPVERQGHLHQLLVDHLVLCDSALDTFRKTESTRQGYSELPGRITAAFVQCGCTTTHLEGLETTLHALFGSPELRWVRLPLRWEGRMRGLTAGSLQDVANELSGVLQ